MKNIRKNEKLLAQMEVCLKEEEKSPATREKYLRDAGDFLLFAQGTISRKTAVAYKQSLMDSGYNHATINAKLAAVRKLLKLLGRENIKIRNLKIQKSAYADEDRMLTKEEYERLVKEPCNRKKDFVVGRSEHPSMRGCTNISIEGYAGGGKEKCSKRHSSNQRDRYSKGCRTNQHTDEQTRLIIETICSTGIRVSELKYFTVEDISKGEVTIYLKGKARKILIPGKLRKKLLAYAKERCIKEGSIFLNGKGKPLHRSQVWQMMKRVCARVGVDSKKVFPHNLRKLFARTFYKVKKDIAKLADVLGHSSINTTRIYIATTAREHLRIIDKMGLVT